MTLEIFHSPFTDPYYNLALEEYLFQNIKQNMVILYLWQNDNTVVLGHNQNPYLQCNMEYINEQKIQIARRLSGGGTVFHDKGNLNYTIICSRENFEKEVYLRMLVNTLRDLGIKAEQSGRNDIIVDGIKISGTAFYTDQYTCYQHGCILVDTDINKMFLCLKVKRDKIIGKGIDSVRSRVMNLSQIDSCITVEQVRLAIQHEFQRIYPQYVVKSVEDIISSINYRKLVTKYSSWEWNMGKQIESKIILYKRFLWGDCTLIFDVKGGYIKDTGLYTDSLETKIFHEIQDALHDVRFSRREILRALSQFTDSSIIVEDIKNLIQNEKQLLET